MINFGKVKPGSILYVPFDTFSGSTGASITASGLSVTDIEIYKNGGVTQRASDTGYTLLDTDGIDFDGTTGIHGFSIDLSSNADSGFFVAGGNYRVVVSAVTVDSQTLSFTAAVFSIGYEGAIIDTTIATLSTQTSFTLTAGPAEDDALNGCKVLIHDIASSVQIGRGYILDYVGASKTVTLAAASSFTAAAGDNISLFMPDLSDIIAISGDNVAADNFETMLDGTGGQLLSLGALEIYNDSPNARPAVNIENASAVTSYPAVNIYTHEDSAVTLVTSGASDDAVRIVTTGSGSSLYLNAPATMNMIGNITGDLIGFADGISGTLNTFDDIWGKIKKFFQLILRKDAAIATDNSAELTEINADGGSGSGAYDNTTDSQQAIKDTLGAIAENTMITGTIANASTTSIDLGTLTFGDDELNNLLIRVFDNSTGEYHSRWIDDYTGTTSVATLSSALPFTTESGVDTFTVYSVRRDVTASIGASDIRSAVGLASANLDTQLGAIDDYLDTEVAAIKAKTDQLTFTTANQVDATALDLDSSAITAIVTAIEAIEIETGYDIVEILKVVAAATAGKASGFPTTNVIYRDILDSKNRISATVDTVGNRTAVTLDVT